MDRVEQLIEAASNLRDKALVAILGRTGVRISEALELNIDDIGTNDLKITIIMQKKRSKYRCPHCNTIVGKKHKFCPECSQKIDEALRENIMRKNRRTIPVDSNTLQIVTEMLECRRRASYHSNRIFPIGRCRAWQIIRELGYKIGIPKLHPHDLRGWFATQWVDGGGDPEYLQTYLGHENIGTTMRYYERSEKKLQEQYEKIMQ